jgi:hypothetical protein
MSKIVFGVAIGAVASIVLLAASVTVYQRNSATASSPAQGSETVDVNDLMKKSNTRALPEENWPPI